MGQAGRDGEANQSREVGDQEDRDEEANQSREVGDLEDRDGEANQSREVGDLEDRDVLRHDEVVHQTQEVVGGYDHPQGDGEEVRPYLDRDGNQACGTSLVAVLVGVPGAWGAFRGEVAVLVGVLGAWGASRGEVAGRDEAEEDICRLEEVYVGSEALLDECDCLLVDRCSFCRRGKVAWGSEVS